MTNSINPQNQNIPGYSGITINITNPALNAQQPNYGYQTPYHQCCQCHPNQNNQGYNPIQYSMTSPYSQQHEYCTTGNQNITQTNNYNYETTTNPIPQNTIPTSSVYAPSHTNETMYPNTYGIAPQVAQNQTTKPIEEVNQAYPSQYYLNNYNYIQNPEKNNIQTSQTIPENLDKNNSTIEEDLSASKEILTNLDTRVAEQKDLEENGKATRVVALTNEYIMSLENYLDNPNAEIRLMAAKEILTRLDEDKNRYDDAALNALLNKMLQDPSKLVRIAALSAFSSQLASGNDYTIELLTQIQNDPNGDKEDALQAANSLLKMSTRTEIKYVKQNPEKSKKAENKELEASKKQAEQLKAQLQKYKEKEIESALKAQEGN